MTFDIERAKIHFKRRLLKLRYGRLYSGLRSILLRHDPINLMFDGTPKDEYDPEVSTILPRLRHAGSVSDVRRLVHEEFVHWFDMPTAGPESAYEAIATDIWALLQGTAKR